MTSSPPPSRQQKITLIKQIDQLSDDDQELLYTFLYNRLDDSYTINYDQLNQTALFDLETLPHDLYYQLETQVQQMVTSKQAFNQRQQQAQQAHQQAMSRLEHSPAKIPVALKIQPSSSSRPILGYHHVISKKTD